MKFEEYEELIHRYNNSDSIKERNSILDEIEINLQKNLDSINEDIKQFNFHKYETKSYPDQRYYFMFPGGIEKIKIDRDDKSLFKPFDHESENTSNNLPKSYFVPCFHIPFDSGMDIDKVCTRKASFLCEKELFHYYFDLRMFTDEYAKTNITNCLKKRKYQLQNEVHLNKCDLDLTKKEISDLNKEIKKLKQKLKGCADKIKKSESDLNEFNSMHPNVVIKKEEEFLLR